MLYKFSRIAHFVLSMKLGIIQGIEAIKNDKLSLLEISGHPDLFQN
jgi:hypothetical protein